MANAKYYMRYIHSFQINSRLGHSVFVICLLILLMSHPLQALIGIRIHYLFFVALSILIIFGLYISRGRYDIIAIEASLIIIFLGIIGSIVSGIMQQLLIGLAGAGMLIAASLTHPVLASRQSVQILIRFNIVILIGAWVGFAYAFSGNGAITEVINPENKQVLYLYLTTFTNSVSFDIIRPTGIFDEPGALAMFSIIVVCLNELCNGKRFNSVLILLLSLITFSVMSLLAILMFLIFFYAGTYSLRNWAQAIVIILILVAGYFAGGDIVQSLYLDRFVFEDGRFAGDNRIGQVLNFIDMVNSDIFFAGADAFPAIYRGGDQSSNPFSIMYQSGVFVWIPYCVLVVWLCSFIVNRSRKLKFVALVLAILILQRPYVYSMYWGVLIDMLLVSIYRYKHNMALHKNLCAGSGWGSLPMPDFVGHDAI